MSCVYICQALTARCKCRTGHFLQIFMGTMPHGQCTVSVHTLVGVRPAVWTHSGVFCWRVFFWKKESCKVFRHLFPLQFQRFWFSTFCQIYRLLFITGRLVRKKTANPYVVVF